MHFSLCNTHTVNNMCWWGNPAKTISKLLCVWHYWASILYFLRSVLIRISGTIAEIFMPVTFLFFLFVCFLIQPDSTPGVCSKDIHEHTDDSYSIPCTADWTVRRSCGGRPVTQSTAAARGWSSPVSALASKMANKNWNYGKSKQIKTHNE